MAASPSAIIAHQHLGERWRECLDVPRELVAELVAIESGKRQIKNRTIRCAIPCTRDDGVATVASINRVPPVFVSATSLSMTSMRGVHFLSNLLARRPQIALRVSSVISHCAPLLDETWNPVCRRSSSESLARILEARRFGVASGGAVT